jgi:hypothetical protein
MPIKAIANRENTDILRTVILKKQKFRQSTGNRSLTKTPNLR